VLFHRHLFAVNFPVACATAATYAFCRKVIRDDWLSVCEIRLTRDSTL
jgi:hypothetical protein